jgi:hypothetical protein
MESKDKLPGFNYKPFSREDLVKSMLELKESGKCPVQNPKFYEPWNLVEYGTEEYEKEVQKYDYVRKQRLEQKRLERERLKRGK